MKDPPPIYPLDEGSSPNLPVLCERRVNIPSKEGATSDGRCVLILSGLAVILGHTPGGARLAFLPRILTINIGVAQLGAHFSPRHGQQFDSNGGSWWRRQKDADGLPAVPI